MILFLVDAVTGLTPADEEAAELLRRSTKPVIVAANKADNQAREIDAAEFYALGWDETYPISASHGRGTGDLLDAIVWALPPETPEELARKAREKEADDWARDVATGHLEPFVVGDEEADEDGDGTGGDETDAVAARWDAEIAAAAEDDEPASIAFVGRPNVGKSSLLNALLGEDRAIVCEVPGHDPRRDRHGAGVGPERGRPHRHRRHPAPGQGRRRTGRGAILDAPFAEGDRPRRRRGPRHRRRRGTHRPGRPRRGLRRRGGPGARRRGQQVGPRRGQDRPDLRPVRRVDPEPDAVPRLRPGRLDQREDRTSASARSSSSRSTSGASAASASRPAS